MRVDTRLLSSGLLLLLASVVERAALPGVSKGNYSSLGCCSFVDHPLRQSKVHDGDTGQGADAPRGGRRGTSRGGYARKGVDGGLSAEHSRRFVSYFLTQVHR